MKGQKVFSCEKCGKDVELVDEMPDVLECCGQPMKIADGLPVCESSATAEHSRFDDLDDPCDDGRSGKL